MNMEAACFFEVCLGHPADEGEQVDMSARQVIDLLRPLDPVIRAHALRVGGVRYHAQFEREADDAILTYIDNPHPRTWDRLGGGCARVLLERYLQLLTVAMTKELSGDAFASLPRGLSEEEQQLGLMLLLLYRMKLPLPPADRSVAHWPLDEIDLQAVGE